MFASDVKSRSTRQTLDAHPFPSNRYSFEMSQVFDRQHLAPVDNAWGPNIVNREDNVSG